MSLQQPPLGLLDEAALFLDFDGTLVELAETPDAIRVAPTLGPMLRQVGARLGGRLALVSGRSIADLESHLECSGLALSGSHGMELRLRDGRDVPLGTRHDLGARYDLDGARERLARLAEQSPGLLVEHKPFGVALHYRQAPHEEERVAALLAELAARTGLTLQQGKMVVELRPPGADKGDAVRAFMTEPEFAGTRPLFVGDDLTDEDAFRAAAELGGGGILVGPERDTAALWRLDDVAAVAAWLAEAAA